jgi:hypothetical protein
MSERQFNISLTFKITDEEFRAREQRDLNPEELVAAVRRNMLLTMGEVQGISVVEVDGASQFSQQYSPNQPPDALGWQFQTTFTTDRAGGASIDSAGPSPFPDATEYGVIVTAALEEAAEIGLETEEDRWGLAYNEVAEAVRRATGDREE